MKDSEKPQEWTQAHDKAKAEGKDFYLDPKTGYVVFTESYHLKRSTCCKSGCRHCPYGFKSL